MNPAAETTALERELAQRISAHGPIPFADFMRECLYHPELGYYSRGETRRFGDFYTSVDVHPIFGRLLARQLTEMWQALGRPKEFWTVEAGAGTGRLAAQILEFTARELPAFYKALRYVAVEQSQARRVAHAVTLDGYLRDGVARSAAELPQEIPTGCVISNELLDALPVHRVVVESGALREIYVGLRGGAEGDAEGDAAPTGNTRSAGSPIGELEERTGPLTSPEIEEYFKQQGITLREKQQAEAGLAACEWIVEAGHRLGRGFVLTVDYGYEAAELYNERHARGTMMAYLHHHASENYLRMPGEQDLTAHVNFTALDLWGSRAGLVRTGCVSQMAFLVALGRGNEFADLYSPGASEVERVRSRLLLKTLIHPEGMGETFQVCIHHKGVSRPQLTGLAGI